MWKFLVRHILRDRIAIILIIGAITIFMGWKASKVTLSYEMATMLPSTDSTLIQYEKFKKKFGEDGSVLFVGIEDKKIFELEHFNEWARISDELKNIDGVQEVISLSRLFSLSKNDSLKKFVFKNISAEKPRSQAELDSVRNVIYSMPLYNGLVYNKETGATLMMLTLDKKKIDSKSRIKLIQSIRETASQYSTKFNVPVHFSGLPFIRTVTSKMVEAELKLFVVLALIVAAIFLFIFFRSWKAVVFPMLIILIAVIFALGMVVLFGYKITILTGIIPPLIIVIGVENCIFLLNKYHYEYRHHGNKALSLSRVIERIGKANLLTNAATATGFAAFIITNNKLLVEFGAIASLNIMVVYVLSLTLVPIFFSYLAPPKEGEIQHMERSLAKGIINGCIEQVTHHRGRIYLVTGILMLIAVFGVIRLTTSGRIVDDIPHKHVLYTDLMFFEKNFKGIMPLEIVVDTKKKKGVLNISTLNKIDRLQDSLQKYPELSKPLSLVEVIKTGRQAFFGGDTSEFKMPTGGELTFMAEYIPKINTGKKNILNNFIDSTYSTTRISVQMANIGTRDIERIQSDLKPVIDTIFNPKKYHVTITGTSVIFLKGTNFLVRNLWESIFLAIIVIGILLAFLFTSWRMILISLVPNLIPQLMTAALMGYTGIPIKPSTILIFSIALGISVDNSIQYLSRYRLQLKHTGNNIPPSVISALKETGYSMIYSSTVLFFGFAIFTLSQFGGTQALGFLISFTLLVAGFLNMFLLPSLLLTLDKWSTTRAFEEPIIQVFRENEDLKIDDPDLPGPDRRKE